MRAWILALIFMLAAARPAPAFTGAEQAGIRAVIGQQIEAFRQDDAAAAYAFAAPKLHEVFPAAPVFMAMVRRAYPQVYRPKSYTFTTLKQEGEQILQAVEIEDSAGDLWTAWYALQQQPDGAWKIAGCWLVRSQAAGA